MTQLSSGRSSFDAFLDRHMLRHALRALAIFTVIVIALAGLSTFIIAPHFLN